MELIFYSRNIPKQLMIKNASNSIKGDYNYHLTSPLMAVKGGIDDVGGVFYLDCDPKFRSIRTYDA